MSPLDSFHLCAFSIWVLTRDWSRRQSNEYDCPCSTPFIDMIIQAPREKVWAGRLVLMPCYSSHCLVCNTFIHIIYIIDLNGFHCSLKWNYRYYSCLAHTVSHLAAVSAVLTVHSSQNVFLPSASKSPEYCARPSLLIRRNYTHTGKVYLPNATVSSTNVSMSKEHKAQYHTVDHVSGSVLGQRIWFVHKILSRHYQISFPLTS